MHISALSKVSGLPYINKGFEQNKTSVLDSPLGWISPVWISVPKQGKCRMILLTPSETVTRD